jgi:two-component system sensor histidine kinase VicK
VEWKRESISLDNLIRELVKKISIEAKNKKQVLEYFMTSSVPNVNVDKDRIEQVLLNIISNAIKYTQEGGTISVYLGQVYNEVYVKVIDNGIGIPKKDLPRIFERFYRVDKARTREFGGTGLGLSIAKEIIEAHGGSITIESENGKGTEVIINLPTA